jgi:predicted dehydrogenase
MQWSFTVFAGGQTMSQNAKTTASDGISRRVFVTSFAAAPMIVPRHVLGRSGSVAPSDRLNLAAIGVGKKGGEDLQEFASTNRINVVALCDVDEEYAAPNFAAWPKAQLFRDFQTMIDRVKAIEAVLVATPDHLHAVATLACLQAGKHVYCEKPLTHSVYEARRITEAARVAKVATQLGNQGHSSEGTRLTCEWIWDGAIGDVRLVEVWTTSGGSRRSRPAESVPVPTTLDWDRWIGPAPFRHYHPAYHPIRWRNWWDFGTGPLGDMASHLIDIPYWALKLGYPTAVEADTTELSGETAPAASTVTYHFPARGSLPPVKLIWFDGGRKPERPAELEQDRQMGHQYGGVIFHGEDGLLIVGCYGDSPRLIPESKMRAYKRPHKTIPRCRGHWVEFVEACIEGKPTCANFEYAGPFTETIMLGNVAIRSQTEIHYDPEEVRIANAPEANRYIRREYRKGWSL